METISSIFTNSKQDALGIILSFVCLVHCVGLSLALLFVPMLDIEHSHFHIWIAFGVFSVGIVAFYRGYCIHKSLDVVLAAVLGFALLMLGLVVEEISTYLSIFSTICGSLVLLFSHYKNSTLGKNCRRCCESQ